MPSTNQIARFLIRSVPNPCIVLMLSYHCTMIKAINRAMCVALGQLIMMSLAKQSKAPQILPKMNLEKLGTDVYLKKKLTVLKAIVMGKRQWKPSGNNRSYLLAACIDDVTIINTCFLFWNYRGRWWDKYGFTSVEPQESHKWLVPRIHKT